MAKKTTVICHRCGVEMSSHKSKTDEVIYDTCEDCKKALAKMKGFFQDLKKYLEGK